MNSRTQFSVFALLLLVTLVAGYFAGLDRGFRDGQQQWMRRPKLVKTYELESVLMPRIINRTTPTKHPNGIGAEILEKFVDELKSDVRPIVWQNDDTTTLDIFIPKMAIIVSGNESIHHDIQQYIARTATAESSDNK